MAELGPQRPQGRQTTGRSLAAPQAQRDRVADAMRKQIMASGLAFDVVADNMSKFAPFPPIVPQRKSTIRFISVALDLPLAFPLRDDQFDD